MSHDQPRPPRGPARTRLRSRPPSCCYPAWACLPRTYSPHPATTPGDHQPLPTFADYIPIVSAAVSEGTRRVYSSYWNRVIDHWGQRRLDEPTASEIKQLVEHIKINVVARRNARGGRSAGEHLIAALRCVYRHAEDDGLINAADNPASKCVEIGSITELRVLER